MGFTCFDSLPNIGYPNRPSGDDTRNACVGATDDRAWNQLYSGHRTLSDCANLYRYG